MICTTPVESLPRRSVTMAEAIRNMSEFQKKLAATPEPERSEIARLWTTGRVCEAFARLEKINTDRALIQTLLHALRISRPEIARAVENIRDDLTPDGYREPYVAESLAEVEGILATVDAAIAAAGPL